MADYVFKRNDAGVRKFLQSDACLKLMEQYGNKHSNGGEVRSFVGYDRAKVFITQEKQK